jgi:hypothetical protein
MHDRSTIISGKIIIIINNWMVWLPVGYTLLERRPHNLKAFLFTFLLDKDGFFNKSQKSISHQQSILLEKPPNRASTSQFGKNL